MTWVVKLNHKRNESHGIIHYHLLCSCFSCWCCRNVLSSFCPAASQEETAWPAVSGMEGGKGSLSKLSLQNMLAAAKPVIHPN